MMLSALPDVLVIGLGPAGSMAAATAAHAGLDVLAIERKQQGGQPVQCAEFIPNMVARDFGDLDPVAAQPVARMLSFVEQDPADIKENFPGAMIDRALFDATLAERAESAGADCRFASAVRSIAEDGSITLADGTRIRPRVLIGADGPRSRPGQAIGAANTEFVETRQITAQLLEAHDGTDIFLSAEIEGGYGWLFPRAGVANIGLGLRPEARHRLKPLLESLHKKLADEGRVGREIICTTGGPIPVGGPVQPLGLLGETAVLLAGDAAGLTNPVTGAGISSAVQSGALAGTAAAEWLGGDEAALQDYADELEDLFGASLRRALKRRRGVLAAYQGGGKPGPADLRHGWVGYPEYWAA
ncbi:MAG: NAD(P)/FAD-dependent oxidoreductase [Rhodospirillaceae bacterium]|jgi:digeranylgeranylglycerophospholipid reductase|nr:NAD(P)/FAD-dependent oxidoreductase [Rhodospirillaceae bacterium]MBT5676191.1 NAD(P)/FAD-dependent oxidoreductase [Rhodospirillaceae bacterium]MBT5778298.1 NAD(P)/FAD-dependent oxidoreductase [Rhodospirillaceae bacterium]